MVCNLLFQQLLSECNTINYFPNTDPVNMAGNTLLEFAILEGKPDIVQYLVNQKKQTIEGKI